MRVSTEGLTEGKENITLKMTRLQRIRLTSRGHSADSLKNSEGIVVVCGDGSIEVLHSRVAGSPEALFRLYERVLGEMDFAAGMNPLNSIYVKSSSGRMI